MKQKNRELELAHLVWESRWVSDDAGYQAAVGLAAEIRSWHPNETPDQKKSAIQLIAEERARQVTGEGWTLEHDDTHIDGEMPKAAASYALRAADVRTQYPDGIPNGCCLFWPWDKSWWKPSEDPIRNLVKSGALIAAEIDRLQRLRGSWECWICKKRNKGEPAYTSRAINGEFRYCQNCAPKIEIPASNG